jgi:hypothetical protein
MGYPYLDNYPYFGYFGHTQVYNRALSASEILDQYNRNIKKYLSSENIISNGLVLNFDASNPSSYVGTGVTINNIAGVGNTGILINGPTFSQLNGGSIVFDGTNDYINVADSPSLGMSSTNAVTVYAWFHATADGINSTREIIHKRNNDPTYVSYGISWGSSSNKNILFSRFGFDDGTVSDLNSDALPKLKWINACTTFDGSVHNMYVDGNLAKTASVSNKRIKDDNLPVTLGSFNGTQEYFQGYISDAKIYNRALSSTEVLQNYNATKNRYIKVLPPISDALVLNLDAGSRASYVGVGTTWYDLSGNNLNGTLVNGPTFAGTGISSSLVFDRTNDYISVADNSLLNTFSAMTLEIIVKYTTTNDQIFVQKYNYSTSNGYSLELFSSGIAALCRSGGSNYLSVSVSSYPANNVYHMIFTLSGTTQTLYINGVSVSSNSSGAAPSLSGTALTIGNRSNLSGTYLGGNVYLTKFYNRALTASEILQNFNFYRTRYGI